MNLWNWIKNKFIRQYIRSFKFPKVYKIGKQFDVASVKETANSLINSNKSLSRFGDGELGWLCGKDILPEDIAFEHSSNDLRNKLIKVIKSSNPNLEIGLSPFSEAYNNHYKNHCRRALKVSMSKLGPNWMKYLNINKKYYNTNVTRAFSAFKHYSYSKYIFQQLKKIWKNKRILIVEGQGTRLGVNNNLFNHARSVSRIECPATNAFESYSHILDVISRYLGNHFVDLSLLALGPTATILAYSLCNEGFRAIDVGHMDVEYEWFLRHKVCDIPYKHVNEVPGGQRIIPIRDIKYKKEITGYVK